MFSASTSSLALKRHMSVCIHKKGICCPSMDRIEAELDFYSRNKEGYMLDISTECCYKCDFIGNFEGCNNDI